MNGSRFPGESGNICTKNTVAMPEQQDPDQRAERQDNADREEANLERTPPA